MKAMKHIGVIVGALCLCLFLSGPVAADESNPVVVVDTSKGAFMVMLSRDRAPITVDNFLSYVDSGFYDGTIFHRVIRDFMIQGGGFEISMVQKPARPAIKNEARNGLPNARGTIAMARTNVIDSATSQFFINVKHNSFLNHKDNSPRGFGYAVFGKVIRGMDVVDVISRVETTAKGGMRDVPAEPVIIRRIHRHTGE
ncbi:MAG: peptidylprolyl isomerase [Thermodesulfobacteriota bacterium]|nr:peptidylprolyl isomerase [Thermodesulfobacteriota bacterium]